MENPHKATLFSQQVIRKIFHFRLELVLLYMLVTKILSKLFPTIVIWNPKLDKLKPIYLATTVIHRPVLMAPLVLTFTMITTATALVVILEGDVHLIWTSVQLELLLV